MSEKTPSLKVGKPSISTPDYHVESGGAAAPAATTLEEKQLLSLGYAPERNLARNRSLLTLLFQSLAIAAIPYGYGGPLLSAIVGGGQLPMWLGWIIACTLDEAIALGLAELASRFPTRAGPHYWVHQLAPPSWRKIASYTTGWFWLVGNWTITLSVTFGFASLLSACVSIARPEFTATDWQLLLIFYAILALTQCICLFLNRLLPQIDTFCAGFTLLTILIVLIVLPAKAEVGRHDAAYTLGHFDSTLSGWGGFGFAIALLPSAYCFSALGMITSMAEEVPRPETSLPWALSMAVPIGLVAALFFILPLCATLPPLQDIIDNSGGQALPYIFAQVTGSAGGGVGLTVLVLIITFFCSISITVAASRTTWSFARDHGLPCSGWLSRVHPTLGVPVNALLVVTAVEALLGLINLGSTSAFNAFVSVGVIALAISYGVPIAISMAQGRKQVAKATWRIRGALGWVLNALAVLWIAFETVLFSMPTSIPTTATSMNYASVVLVGLMSLALAWYTVAARKIYVGPPESHL